MNARRTSKGSIVGLDVGGTQCAVVIGDQSGEIHRRAEFPTCTERGFEPVFEKLCGVTAAMLHEAETMARPASALSVSIGGPMDIDGGIILSPPNLPGWDRIPLRDLLEKRFGVSVFIEHDGNAGALAEWYFGAARGANHVIFLTMGTGFGGGLILNGALYRGACSLAGEVGHIRLASDGPEAFGKAGSWEAFCSGTGFGRLAAWRYPERFGRGEITPRELAALADRGDGAAAAVIEEAGRWLGRGLALLLDVLNPEVIVIGTLAIHLGERVLAPAREEMRREALPGSLAACRVVPAALGERLGDVASLCAAIAAQRGSAV